MENEQLLRLIHISLENGYGVLLTVGGNSNSLSMLKIMLHPELGRIMVNPVSLVIAWNAKACTVDYQWGHTSSRLTITIPDLITRLPEVLNNTPNLQIA